MDEMNRKRKKNLAKFIDPKTGKYDETWSRKVADLFRKKSRKILETFQNTLSNHFESLFENIYPLFALSYYKDLQPDCVKDYEILRRHSKLTKYQKAEYEKEHQLNQVDLFLASLNLDKRQYNFFKKSVPAQRNPSQSLRGWSHKITVKRQRDHK